MAPGEESAIGSTGAVVVCALGLIFEIFVGMVIIMALCTQRYDKDEKLNQLSFASDIRRLSTTQMSDDQFHRKLIRYARYAIFFQWLSYFICLVLILTHEFLPGPVFIDHMVYIAFLINVTCLFLTLRNVGIYFFFPLTDEKNFVNPTLQAAAVDRGHMKLPTLDNALLVDDENEEEEEEKKEFEPVGTTREISVDTEASSDPFKPVPEAANKAGNESATEHRFSHHHYGDEDFMADPVEEAPKTGNADWDAYTQARLRIRMAMIHVFRCLGYTSIIYWIGYVIAFVHGDNDILLATLSVADILLGILTFGHLHYCRKLKRLLQHNEHVLVSDDTLDEWSENRQKRLFILDRWIRADIGLIVCFVVAFVVQIIGISTTNSKFSWPESHPVFLATILVIVVSCQMACCQYIWETKSE